MSNHVVQVLTYKSVENILATGGTQSWALDKSRAENCTYVVCCRNAHTREPEGPEAHGSAFLVGKIRDVVPSTETVGRWLIRISSYAIINVADCWEGRNPVRFYEEYQYEDYIDFEAIVWTAMPDPIEVDEIHPLTIHDAKLGLSKAFGVSVDAIEIVIRG